MIKLTQIANVMAHYDKTGEYTAAEAMRRLLVGGLSPQQKAALKLVRRHWMTTPDICTALGIKANHGGTLMLDLYYLHLVNRQCAPGKTKVIEWIERRTPVQEDETV